MASPLPVAGPRFEAETGQPIRSAAARLSLVTSQEARDASEPHRSLGADRAALGIGALLLSTVLFPMSDMVAKALAQHHSGLEVAWMRYAVLVMIVAPLIARNPRVLRTARPLLQLTRGVSSAGATALALVGFMFMPVADATAIAFCAPLIVTGLACLVLKERVAWQRWVAAGVGFTGILIIVQPGGSTFQLATLLPLASSVFSACTVITTRLGRTERVETTVVISSLVGFALLSAAVLPTWKTPDLASLGLGLTMGTLAAVATVLQIIAFRCAPASLLAPFSYAQILWAIGIGWLVFGTVPNVAMLVGSTVVIGSGCAVAWRERPASGSPTQRRWTALRRELARLHPARRAAA